MTKITLESRLRQVLAHPMGEDVVVRLMMQLNKPMWLLDNPLVGAIRLKTLQRLLHRRIGRDFILSVIALLNHEQGVVDQTPGVPAHAWWKEAVFYQIYPRSFQDSNGDGIGDLQGIIQHLDALHELGVDALWLCPIYCSPDEDNGYDIADYDAIDPKYGSMADFDALLAAVHARGMKLIMDLVINHTSAAHAWYQEALNHPNSPKRSWYFFREGAHEPNNWTSFFSGSAWSQNPDGSWSLHLFSPGQMDLNWQAEGLRTELMAMINRWLAKGVDGFRLDVINYISKDPDLPNGNQMIGKLMGYTGIEHYFWGAKLHDYLRLLRASCFAPANAFCVGETPGPGLRLSQLLTQTSRQELDLVFSFDHLESGGHQRFDAYRYDLDFLRRHMERWQGAQHKEDWMALFFENHDNPRMVAKIDPEGIHRVAVAKLLLMMALTLRGTPFIYQGQELGLHQVSFTQLAQFRDVESLRLAQQLSKEGMLPEEVLAVLNAGSRDHARRPYPWKDAPNGGFTEGTPWIDFPEQYRALSWQVQRDDRDSVWSWTRDLIALRRKHQTLIYGSVSFPRTRRALWVVCRKDAEHEYLVVYNLSDKVIKNPGFPGHILLMSEVDHQQFHPYGVMLIQIS